MAVSLALVIFILCISHHTYAIIPEDIYNCQPNNEACNQYNCSTLDAIERSGYVCHHFPYFTGGWQLVNYNTYWMGDMETSTQCDNVTIPALQTTCMQWSTSSSTYSNMNQTCFCSSNSTTNCAYWECHSNANIQNHIYDVPTAHCNCLHFQPNIVGNTTCIQWNCAEVYDTQYPNINAVNATSDNAKLYNASYQCLSDKPDPSSDYYNELTALNTSSFCWHWFADKINLDFSEWKMTSCQCQIPAIISETKSYCYQWSCSERSMQYYHITPQQFNVGWIIISAAGGIVLMCVCAKRYHPKNSTRSRTSKCCMIYCLFVVTAVLLSALLILCFIVSGLVGVIVVCSVWILSTVVISPLVKWLWKRKQQSYWVEDEDNELRYSNNSTWNRRNKKTGVYDFWSGTGKENDYNKVYEYEPYDPI